MSRPRLLVVSVVHHADDTRIREKTIRSLGERWEIHYRTRSPGPSDGRGLSWKALAGGRISRNLAALRHLLFESYDVAQVHDPELLPAALLARLVRRKRIVFDVHENVPGQIMTKDWVPLRGVVAAGVGWLMKASEPILDITLAESGYEDLFAHAHPVFPNYPDLEALPAAAGVREDGPDFVYVGGVTEQRGLRFLVDVVPEGSSLTIVGPYEPEFGDALRDIASQRGVDLVLTGRLPHGEAMSRCHHAAVAVSPLLDTPNYRHSLPTKVLEYLALGLPVVASDLPGTAEVVGDTPAVTLVEPGDRSAWSMALKEVLAAALAGDVDSSGSTPTLRWPRGEIVAFYDALLES